MPQKPSYNNAKQTPDNQACVGTHECACKCARPAKVSVTAYSSANESDETRDECEEVKEGYHGRRAKLPNDPKLSDRGVRRGTCMVGGKRGRSLLLGSIQDR